MELKEYLTQLSQLDEAAHQYELQQNGKEWTIEEETLTYLADAGTIGREIMAQSKSLPEEVYDKDTLGHQLAQNLWWLAVIAKHQDIDLEAELQKFLVGTIDPTK